MAYILLVNPNKVEYPSTEGDISGAEVSPPLGLLLLGAVLREKRHQVRIFDRQTTERERDLSRELDEYAKALQEGATPDLVGITCVTPFRSAAKAFIAKTREIHPHVKIVVGGPDATFASKEYLTPVCADLAVLGEGELTLLALADGVEPSSIPGVAYMKKGAFLSTETPDTADLDKLPFPARDLIKLNRYPKEAASMTSSRGCLYQCIFCCSSEFWGRQFRTYSPRKLADEIELLHRDYGYNMIRHHDDNWAYRSEAFISDLRDELTNRGLANRVTHEVETSPVTLNETKIRLMKQMGVNTVWISMETAQPHLLKYLKKPYSLEDVEMAVELLREADIAVGLYVIFGMPDETYEQAKETVDKAWALRPAYVGASILTAYPGTQLYNNTPPGKDFNNLFPDLAGWAHCGDYLGRKMTKYELLKVFAYAYNRFGNRLGNSYRLRGMFQFDQELQGLVEIIGDDKQLWKIRRRNWLELREKVKRETEENKKAALEIAYEDLGNKIIKEPTTDRFHFLVKSEFEPKPPPLPAIIHPVLINHDQPINVRNAIRFRDLREEAYRNLVERVGKTVYFGGVKTTLSAYRDAVIEDDVDTQLSLFEEIVSKLWPQNMGREGVRILFNGARKSEPLLTFLGLRKHFLHQFHVFLLGSYILAELQDSMSQSAEAKQLGLTSEGLYNTWLMASTFHDIGLIATKCPDLNLELASIFESLGFNQTARSYKSRKRRKDLLQAQIKTQNGGMEVIDLMSSLRAWFSESGIINGGTVELERGGENHGILGALVMLRTLMPSLKTNHESAAKHSILLNAENRDVANALAAIAVHGLDTGVFSKQLNFKNYPVPFLLRLTDELDEEKRMIGASEDKPDLCLVDLNLQTVNAEKTIEVVLTPSAYLSDDISKSKKVSEDKVRNYYEQQKKWFRVSSLSESRLSGCDQTLVVVATLQLEEPLQLFRTVIIQR